MRIKSNPDPVTHETTQLELIQNGLNISLAIKLITAGNINVDILKADLKNLFTIRFNHYDLVNNRMTGGFVEYSSSRATSVSLAEESGGVTLSYVIPPSANAIGGNFGNLEAKAYIVPPVAAENYGWINFDLSHKYPSGISSGNPPHAWEEQVTFPVLTFTPESLANFRTFPEYGTPLPPLSFGALYTLDQFPNAINYAQGIALHAQDTYGYHKEFHFEKVGTTRQFYFNALCPIHLKNGDYVHPVDDATHDGFRMSQGDALGFGGNRIIYRLHAFQVQAPCDGATIRWYDILNIYRRWLRIRKPDFYTKYKRRTPNGPVDSMSPFTVIANYGLDGPIDPATKDPDPKLQDLNKWLELHPLKDGEGEQDMPGNKNLSLLKLLNILKGKLVPSGVKLEAQIWGFEMAGFYRFYGGLPPASCAISGKPNKFKEAMAQLVASNIIPCATTDPLAPIFNRGRFRGHLIKKSNGQWGAAIPHPFPGGFKSRSCAVSDVKINGVPFNRIWAVRGFAGLAPAPTCTDADMVFPLTKLGPDGSRLAGLAAILGTGMYRANIRRLCPTREIENLYLNKWLQAGLLDQGIRLIEFMKHGFDGSCYDKAHAHIDPVPPQTAPYTNAIGTGSWYAARCQSMLKGLQDRGYSTDNSFSLTIEGVPTEVIIPYVDQFYSDAYGIRFLDEVSFNFLYSQFITPKQTLFRDFAMHPGYKERRKGTQKPPLPEVLAEAREDATKKDEAKPLTDDARATSFTRWLGFCTKYFNDYFVVDNHGIAPKDYEITNTSPPETYTYNRCVQDVFHLRVGIFEYGASAVVGRRLLVPAVYAEEPADYNEELINMAARGAKLQMLFKDYFLRGYMLGEVDFLSGNDELWTWGSPVITPRPFDDIKALLDDVQKDDAQFGPSRLPILDLISRIAERETYYNKDGQVIARNDFVTYPRFPNMVWQLDGNSPRILYAIAHIGNKRNVPARFLYSRGLDSAPPAQMWKKTITIISESGVTQTTGTAQIGQVESSVIFPCRSFVAIEFTKA